MGLASSHETQYGKEEEEEREKERQEESCSRKQDTVTGKLHCSLPIKGCNTSKSGKAVLHKVQELISAPIHLFLRLLTRGKRGIANQIRSATVS